MQNTNPIRYRTRSAPVQPDNIGRALAARLLGVMTPCELRAEVLAVIG